MECGFLLASSRLKSCKSGLRPYAPHYANLREETPKDCGKTGFVCVRTEGDHFGYVKTGVPRPVVIPDWDEVPVFIIKNNLRTAGLSREEYFTLLDQV